MPFDPDPLLDLVAPARSADFRFDLLDTGLATIGTLTVSRESTPVVDHSADRSIARTLSGFRLTPVETLDVNPLSDRVQPIMILADGSEWPLGVFVFGSWSRTTTTAGTTPEGDLTDLSVTVDQPCHRTVSADPGGYVADMIADILAEVGVTSANVQPTAARFGQKAPPVWKAGTSWLSILAEVAGVAGFLAPAFDRHGTLQCREAAPAAALADSDVIYEPGERIIDGSIVETDTTIDAPNRYVVIDTAATDQPIVGTYDIPDDAPHSALNRGRTITRTIEVQGIGSTSAAAARAERAYLSARTAETVAFSSAVDPRHDLWNVVGYRGYAWRERGWKITCRDGQPMTHEARRYYR